MTFRNALLFLSILLVSLVGAALPAAAEVTVSQDVAPIVFQRCTGCHRPGEAAPFSLMTYDDVGKTMKMTATFPDGTVKTLLDIQNWDFAWQDRYFFEEPIVLPKGTRLDSEVSWDNSDSNPKNPSRPPIQVQWGEQTKDEMGAVGLQVYPTSEANLMKLRSTYQGHVRDVARDRIRRDPTIMAKVREIMGN